MTDPLDSPALDGSPGQAFASHKARANGIARFFAQTHPLNPIKGKADEDKTITLLAHLHAASHDPDFAVGGIVSREHIPAALRRLNRGDGLVGTRHDYDMALKGLMTIAPVARGPEEVRPVFRQLRELRDSLGLTHLSMGMTDDFEVAIEEGATMVRIGRAIFGG